MHAYRCVNEIVLAGEAQGGFQVWRTVAGADGHHAFDAGLAGAREHFGAVRIELLVVQMAVRIYQLHWGSFISTAPRWERLPGTRRVPACRPRWTRPQSFRSIRCHAACAVAGSRRSPLCGRPTPGPCTLRRCLPRCCAAAARRYPPSSETAYLRL